MFSVTPDSFLSFLFKLCLMIVHIMKMCTSYFVHISQLFLGVLNLDIFPSKMLRGGLGCVICNSVFIALCSNVLTSKMCTFYFVQI